MRYVKAVAYALILSLLVFCGLLLFESNSKLDGLRAAVERSVAKMATYTTKWTDKNGLDHEVTTTKQDGETDDQHAARHAAAVAALLAIYPKA